MNKKFIFGTVCSTSSIDADPRQTTRKLAEQLNCHHSTVERHLHALGKVHKYRSSSPHQLSIDNLAQRASICASLLFRQKHAPFLEPIVTGDEKWMCYANVYRRRQWLDPDQKPLPDVKPDLHPKKIMLCIWWDMSGVTYFELLDINETITADVYSQQLQWFNEVLLQKRPTLANQKDVILLYGNSRSHVAKLIQQKIEQLGWKVLPHLPWSPDLSPTDYHLFLSLRNYLCNKHYDDFDELKSDLTAFFESKPASFYRRGIELLPEKCCWKQWRLYCWLMFVYLCWKINLLLNKKKNVQNLCAKRIEKRELLYSIRH